MGSRNNSILKNVTIDIYWPDEVNSPHCGKVFMVTSVELKLRLLSQQECLMSIAQIFCISKCKVAISLPRTNR